ncbi:MAG: hypothetical protein V7678_08270 [Brevundimonas sp.]
MTVPVGFHHVRLELAREPEHPTGDPRFGYDLVAPLNADHKLDKAACDAQAHHCRVRRFRNGATEAVGRLARADDGRWFFDFDPGEADDEFGFRLDDERFVPGEYISVQAADGAPHTFRVMKAAPVEQPAA